MNSSDKMDNYLFHQPLQDIWEKSVERYKQGQRGSETYYSREELAFLASIGHRAREVYDFAEDFINYGGEPDFGTFLLIAAVRRHYFIHQMQGKPGSKVVDTGDLPPKKEAVRGIEWLPRLIEKARAKLRGEMSDDLMYCCSGDQSFFKSHKIHPAEFLSIVAEHFDDDEAIIDFVVTRSKAVAVS